MIGGQLRVHYGQMSLAHLWGKEFRTTKMCQIAEELDVKEQWRKENKIIGSSVGHGNLFACGQKIQPSANWAIVGIYNDRSDLIFVSTTANHREK